MIFSFILSLIRTIKEKDNDYVDIGLGFIMMSIFECFILTMFFIMSRGVFTWKNNHYT